jgi:hypothetical protein
MFRVFPGSVRIRTNFQAAGESWRLFSLGPGFLPSPVRVHGGYVTRAYEPGTMARTNAQKQARWRDARKKAYGDLHGTPEQWVEAFLFGRGVKGAKQFVSALNRRLAGIKQDCPACL